MDHQIGLCRCSGRQRKCRDRDLLPRWVGSHGGWIDLDWNEAALRRPVVLLAVLVLLSPLLVFVSYALLDPIASRTLGQLGPAWFEAEAGIVVTGIAWLVFGATVFRKRGTRRSA